MSPTQSSLLLRNLGCILIGAGIPLRFLLPGLHDTLGPAINSIPSLFLASGSGVLLLSSLSASRSSLPLWIWLWPLVFLPGLWPMTSKSVPHGLEMMALALSCTAIFATARVDFSLRRGVWHIVLAAGGVMAIIGCAQSLWQAEEVAEFARTHGNLIPDHPSAEAFLASRRAAATLVSPNLFAGWLLLILPAACTLRGKYRALTLLLIGAFGASGSAGATLSLLLACGLLIFRGPLRSSWWPRVGLTLGVLGFSLLLLCVLTGWYPPAVGHKVASFLQRVDYNAQGLRMFPSMGVLGAGFHSVADLRHAVAKPMEASSVYLHNSWLQILIECGPIAFIVIATLILKAWTHGWRRANETQLVVSTDCEAPTWPLLVGAVLGCGLAAVLAPSFLSALSLNSHALLGAGLTAVCFTVILLILHRARIEAPSALPLLVGLLGLIIHGFLDYDLYSPAVVLACGIVLALLGQTHSRELLREESTGTTGIWRKAATTLAAVLALALPLPIASIAMSSDETAQSLRLLGTTGGLRPANSRAAIVDSALNALPNPELWSEAGRSSASIHQLLERLATLPAELRERPSWRQAEATLRSRKAMLNPEDAAHQAALIATLIRPDERPEASLHYAHWRALKAGSAPRKRLLEVARQAIAAAGHFGLTGEDESWLKALKATIPN